MGFEPTTPCLQSRCSSHLSYVPARWTLPADYPSTFDWADNHSSDWSLANGKGFQDPPGHPAQYNGATATRDGLRRRASSDPHHEKVLADKTR